MRFKSSTLTVTTSGTRLQFSNTADRVKSLSVRARPGNTNNAFLGDVTVTTSLGWTLQPGESKTLDFGDGSAPFSDFYADVTTSGEKLDWTAILE